MKIKFLIEELQKKPEDADFMREPSGGLVDVEIYNDGGRTVVPFVISRKGGA